MMKNKRFNFKAILSLIVMLFTSAYVHAQYDGIITYDFTDGTIITNLQSEDGKLKLGDSYSYHGTGYGLNLKIDQTITIDVDGSATIRFLGSQYSKLKMKGTAVADGDLGVQNTQVTNDKVDTYDFVYSGTAATLTFTTIEGSGNDVYLPKIEVIPTQKGIATDSVHKNIVYHFDLRDESIVAATDPGNVTIEKGLFKIEAGCCNAYAYHGTQHGIYYKTGNLVTLKVAGNTKIRLGGDQYSGGTIVASSASGEFDVTSQSHQTASTYSDGSPVWVDFLYVGGPGTVVFENTNSTSYLPFVELSPVPYEVSLSSYAQKSGTVTINGIEISITTGATSAENSTVSVSEGILLSSEKDKAKLAINLAGAELSSYTPTTSGDISSATIDGNMVNIVWSDDSTDPKSFSLELMDNSILHGTYSYDFRDGTIITNQISADEKLVLGGAYSHHGEQYGLNMKVDQTIDLTVSNTSAIRFLGSKYSSLTMNGTLTETGDLGVQDTKVENDLVDTYDYVYYGGEAKLNFTATPGSGNDIYLPSIEVVPAQMGAAYASAQKNIPYFYDFRDGSIIPTTTSGKENLDKGLVSVRVGDSNAYGYNGSQHGSVLKDGNQIILAVAGNSKIHIGGSIYSNGTIAVSSETGTFDVPSQSSTTVGNFGNDGSTVDFTYLGEAGLITLDFTGTNYVPYITVAPIPFEVSLRNWVQKSGTVSINGTDINITSAADASEAATVTVSSGTVISATNENASILIDLSGKALAEYTPEVSGDIASAMISNDTLMIAYADENSDPISYVIKVADNSTKVAAEPGKTYSYNFADGSEVPQTSYQSLRYSTFPTADGIVTINSNTDQEAKQFGYHDATHGLVMFEGNSFDMAVAGNATITFVVCTYGSATDAMFEFTDPLGNPVGMTEAQNIGLGDGAAKSYSYSGQAGIVTATIKSENFTTAEIYIHGLTIENEAVIQKSNGKIDVWDFAAEQLNADLYNNKLNDSIINSWYDPSITVGSTGNVLPSFSAGVLNWVGGHNDRLRSTNSSLTRYDENIGGVSGYNGRVYVNSAAATGRYMSLTLSADDEVTIVAKTDAGGVLNFKYVPDPEYQTDIVEIGSDLIELTFTAKRAGTYHIYDSQGKPSYFRIYRKDAKYVTLSGNVDVSGAEGIPSDYHLQFTNEAGKIWNVAVNNGSYKVDLPEEYTYSIGLANANGYVISNGNSILASNESPTHNIVIKKVELFTVSGNIKGIDGLLDQVMLVYTPDPAEEKIFVPHAEINTETGAYSVDLEPNCAYTISALGVNDYLIPDSTLTITAATTKDVVFETKPTYKVSIDAPGLSADALAKLQLTFTNLYEEGYVYHFDNVENIALRDGAYTLSHSGIDEYPVSLGLVSNVKIEGAAITKSLNFSEVTDWTFDDQVIDGNTPAYKGLLFTGAISNEITKGHLSCKDGATIQVPVSPNDKITVSYYYTADFSIEGGDAYTTASNSTTSIEFAEYVYTGTADGFVTITIGASATTTYITNIAIGEIMEYTEVITVGSDKDFATINEAIDAIGKMVRTNDQRVTVMIDPGNYEEMLVVNTPNITLKNAAATPDIAMQNAGVDISANAVRITSYYGHGYSYYSMGADQRWHADILEVNKENGYLSYENKGAGTTNGSYWNATVVVNASGFQAEDIIFENSFNQYISKKESEDIVVMWSSGSKGERPTDYGNTAVQDRSFVERAAALAITNDVDKVVLTECRVIGRQDSFYGGVGSRVAVYKGVMMGAVDYIFGGMVAVFYQTKLAMNTSSSSSDKAYLTAAQQNSGRGYLMYECIVTSAEPGTESASTTKSKPGYFGRPWQATTSEVVFYNTTVETTDFPGSDGKSLIEPEGWASSLGGESKMMYEFGTNELSGADNSSARVSWSTLLTEPKLSDGTEITTFNFTKGNDDWDPFADIVKGDATLASLEVEEATLSPAFDPAVTSYEITIPDTITSITVTATASNSESTVSIGSFSTLPGSDVVKVTSPDGTVMEYTIKVNVDVTVITGLLSEQTIKLYPNPTSETLNITLQSASKEEVMINVLSMTGAQVKTHTMAAGSLKTKVDVSDLNAGIYIIQLMTEGQSQSLRLQID